MLLTFLTNLSIAPKIYVSSLPLIRRVVERKIVSVQELLNWRFYILSGPDDDYNEKHAVQRMSPRYSIFQLLRAQQWWLPNAFFKSKNTTTMCFP